VSVGNRYSKLDYTKIGWHWKLSETYHIIFFLSCLSYAILFFHPFGFLCFIYRFYFKLKFTMWIFVILSVLVC